MHFLSKCTEAIDNCLVWLQSGCQKDIFGRFPFADGYDILFGDSFDGNVILNEVAWENGQWNMWNSTQADNSLQFVRLRVEFDGIFVVVGEFDAFGSDMRKGNGFSEDIFNGTGYNDEVGVTGIKSGLGFVEFIELICVKDPFAAFFMG